MDINAIQFTSPLKKSQNFKGILDYVGTEQAYFNKHNYIYHPCKDETDATIKKVEETFHKDIHPDRKSDKYRFVIGKRLKITKEIYDKMREQGISDNTILDQYI